MFRLRVHSFLHRLPPGPGQFPYFDVQLGRRINRNPLGTLMEFHEEYGRVFTLRLLGLEMVFLVGPEANRKILVDDYRDFSWGEGFYSQLVPFIGRGLLTTDDMEHDRARNLLAPAFYPAKIRGYGDRMIERAERAVGQLPAGETFRLHAWTRQLALKIAGDVLLGMQMPRGRAESFAELFEEGLKFYGGTYTETLLLKEFSGRFRRMKERVAELDEAIYEEIDRRRMEGADGEAVLDMLIRAEHNGDRFTDKEVRDQLITLLFAGHDTSAATVAWLFSLLGRHREVYRRLQAEIDDELGGASPTAGDLIDGLPYLEQVLRETLRMFPAAWFGPRKAREEFSIYGYHIPAGTHVAYSSWLTHRSPLYWEDPDAFDPDRFAEENYRDLEAGLYVPFGRGPRTCIGMQFGKLEVKAITVALMQRFRLELFPGQSFQARTVPTISPKYDVRLTPHRR